MLYNINIHTNCQKYKIRLRLHVESWVFCEGVDFSKLENFFEGELN